MIFLDSNIWLYGYTDKDGRKRDRSIALAPRKNEVALSSQVVNEVTSNLIRLQLMQETEIRQLGNELYADYSVLEIGRHDIVTASELRESIVFHFGTD